MRNAINVYNTFLDKKPLVTKVLSASFIFSIGDYLCQKMEMKFINPSQKFDMKRLAKQALFGVIVAPYLHFQFNIAIPWLFPQHMKWAIGKSVAYAVLISDSIFNASYFTYMALAKGKSFSQAIREDIPEKFIPVQITNMQIWPMFTGLNFTFVPMNYRVLVDNIGTIFWNIYLSYVEHKKH